MSDPALRGELESIAQIAQLQTTVSRDGFAELPAAADEKALPLIEQSLRDCAVGARCAFVVLKDTGAQTLARFDAEDKHDALLMVAETLHTARQKCDALAKIIDYAEVRVLGCSVVLGLADLP